MKILLIVAALIVSSVLVVPTVAPASSLDSASSAVSTHPEAGGRTPALA